MSSTSSNSGDISRRKTAKQLSYRLRYLAISSHEQVEAQKLKKLVYLLSMFRNRSPIYAYCFKLATIKYLSLTMESLDDREPLERPIRRVVSVDSISKSFCRNFFKFKKADLHTLIELFEIPDICKFDNDGAMDGEEVFLRGLFELSTGDNQELMCNLMFGREQSAQSRASSYFVNYLYDHFNHLLHTSLGWWYRNGFFKLSADAIRAKIISNGYPADGDFPYEVAHFVDCKCLPTSVVGGGPAEDGANSARWDESIQRAFYNGWKSIHGLKHQTINSAFGITVDIEGPATLRRNDLALLPNSDINNRVAELQANEPAVDQCVIFGDSAYSTQSHLRSYGDVGRWNAAMKKVRISIEWDYGTTGSLFPYLNNKRKLQMLGSSKVAKVYSVCTLLKNCHVILYGCQTSNYFDVSLPNNFIEYYIKQIDLP